MNIVFMKFKKLSCASHDRLLWRLTSDRCNLVAIGQNNGVSVLLRCFSLTRGLSLTDRQNKMTFLSNIRIPEHQRCHQQDQVVALRKMRSEQHRPPDISDELQSRALINLFFHEINLRSLEQDVPVGQQYPAWEQHSPSSH